MREKALLFYRKYQELLVYFFFGGLTTAVNYAAFFLFAWLLPVETTTAPTAIAWILSVLFAYATNRAWVFRSKTRGPAIAAELAAFMGARVLSLLLDMAIMWVAVDYLGYNTLVMKLVIKLISNVLVIIVNYFLSKFLIFRKTTDGQA